MGFERRRWIYLFSGMLIELCAGLPYSWSVFQNLLAEKYQWSTAGTAGAYSFSSICMIAFSLLAATPLMNRIGLSRFLALGGLIYAVGTVGCGLIQGSLAELYLYYGVCIGVGTAILYPTLTSYAVRLFPDRPGLASGVMVGGYGCGPFVIAPLLAKVHGITGDISKAFLPLGILFALVILPLSLLLREPPEGWGNGVHGQSEQEQAQNSKTGVSGKSILRHGLFYLVYATFALAIANGTMLVTQASPILRDRFYISVAAAANIVGGISISNTVGRLLWGGISDRIGLSRSTVMIHVAMLVGFGLLLIGNLWLSIGAMLLCVFCFGGASTLLAPCTAQAFGPDQLKQNYPIMFSVFGLAGILGPVVCTNLGHGSAFLAGTVAAAGGVAVSVMYHKIEVRMDAEAG